VLAWLANSGPFWDDEREPNVDDYFECKQLDVTDEGLGEAARRKLNGKDARSFSFIGGPVNFEESPLVVEQGIPEDRLATLNILNYWGVDALAEAAEAAKPPASSWSDVIDEFPDLYPNMVFSPDILEQLKSQPFSRAVAERLGELLTVLEELVGQSDAHGKLSPRGVELLNNHFVGEKAWFSNESDKNKARFKKELTFRDPLNRDREIFCPWHGKIKVSQFRVHLEWPRAEGQREIKVVYIGPKITKD
jgi:hypothetical protein